MIQFSLNSEAWNTDREMEELSRAAQEEAGSEIQTAIDQVFAEHAGQSIDAVASILRDALAQVRCEWTDEDCRPLAETISLGESVTIEFVLDRVSSPHGGVGG